MKSITILLILILVSFVAVSSAISVGDETEDKSVTAQEKPVQQAIIQKAPIQISRSIGSDVRERQLLIMGVPEPVAKGVHVKLGRSAEWVIDRSVKVRGWSFSGYSITSLDDQYRIHRWHFGIISGELDIDAANSLVYRGINARSDYRDEFEWRRTKGIVVGIKYTLKF